MSATILLPLEAVKKMGTINLVSCVVWSHFHASVLLSPNGLNMCRTRSLGPDLQDLHL